MHKCDICGKEYEEGLLVCVNGKTQPIYSSRYGDEETITNRCPDCMREFIKIVIAMRPYYAKTIQIVEEEEYE